MLFFLIICRCLYSSSAHWTGERTAPVQFYPRWDKADRDAYYRYTGDNLVSLVSELDELIIDNSCSTDEIDEVYERIVSALIISAVIFFVNFDGARS